MGLQINLKQMLNLPQVVPCPLCKKPVDGRFDDFDIEAGDPNPTPGYWELDLYCHVCEHSFTVSFNLIPPLITIKP